jgi:hypothetical protein
MVLDCVMLALTQVSIAHYNIQYNKCDNFFIKMLFFAYLFVYSAAMSKVQESKTKFNFEILQLSSLI